MRVDALIIGGGFFGLYVAEHLARRGSRVLVCEAGGDFMQRASYVNQARVHNGYHYPRSLLTAFRSRVNFPLFVEEFPGAVVKDFDKYYAIARTGSKVSAAQFQLFIGRIGAPIRPAPNAVRKLFDPNLIEDVFVTQEYAFDSAKLKSIMLHRIEQAAVETMLSTTISRMAPRTDGSVDVTLASPQGEVVVNAEQLFNCTYSRINAPLAASNLPIVPLKHEVTEVVLVQPPEEIAGMGITVMCGPFFSTMPFPAQKLHSFTHVRYTPHFQWHDEPGNYRDPWSVLQAYHKQTNYPHMIRDAIRYMPCLAKAQYIKSLWEVKTVLPASEADDSRPILFRTNHGLPGHHCLMGAKIDNVYDVVAEIDKMSAVKGVA